MKVYYEQRPFNRFISFLVVILTAILKLAYTGHQKSHLISL